MHSVFWRATCVGLVAAMALLLALDAAAARARRHPASSSAEAAFWNGVVPIENGVPIIMKGYHPPATHGASHYRRADRAVRIPRGSSSFVDIPPPNPSPYSPNSPPAAALTNPTVQPYQPPHITTFGDRVNDAIHAYPLERGLGNNPVDQQQFIRQRVNQ